MTALFLLTGEGAIGPLIWGKYGNVGDTNSFSEGKKPLL